MENFSAGEGKNQFPTTKPHQKLKKNIPCKFSLPTSPEKKKFICARSHHKIKMSAQKLEKEENS